MVGNTVVARLLRHPRQPAQPFGPPAIHGSTVGQVGMVLRLPGDDKLTPSVRKARMEARALAIKGAPGPVLGKLKRELKAAAASHPALEPFEARIVALEATGKAKLGADASAMAAAAAKKKADAALAKAGRLGVNGKGIPAKQLSEVFANVRTAVEALKGGTTTDWVAAMRGRKWGDEHGNAEGHLPAGTYKEYYVQPRETETEPGPHRLVANADLTRIYYSANHYGQGGATPAFVKLTGPGVDPPEPEPEAATPTPAPAPAPAPAPESGTSAPAEATSEATEEE